MKIVNRGPWTVNRPTASLAGHRADGVSAHGTRPTAHRVGGGA
jgi:hypothetical protein